MYVVATRLSLNAIYAVDTTGVIICCDLWLIFCIEKILNNT